MAKILPVDGESLRICPKVYAQHVQVTAGEDASIMFCHRMTASSNESGEDAVDVAFPQVICYLNLTHFLRFADMIGKQAEAIRRAQPILVQALESITSQDGEDADRTP